MGLSVAHLFGGDDGETHFADVTLETNLAQAGSEVSMFSVPTQKITYAEYLDEEATSDEVIPGFHTTPSRHFITPLQGGFEVTTTTGESRRFRPGDWILFDDIGSKGHLTKRVGLERRVNLIIEVAEEWNVPRSTARRRPLYRTKLP